jgi:acetyl-CoA acyltransferase
MAGGAYIIDAVRTPVGRRNGMLSHWHPADLLAEVIAALVARTGIEPGQVDDVLVGCLDQVGEQGANVARSAILAAGFPESVPAATIDRQCGSSQQAAHFAAQGVMAGAYDIVIACGVESMSRVPMGTASLGQDPFGASMAARYPDGLVHQGVSAELVAARWGLDRDELDAFAAESHRRAASAAETGAFDRELVPVTVHGAQGDGTISADETIRAGTTREGLAGLRSSFRTDEMAARFPDLSWSITPGNSSPLTDGASAVLVMEESVAVGLGLTPRARFHSFAVVGDDPLLMLTGPIPATRAVLERAGLTLDQIDAVEVNEAFAPVPLAWARELDGDLGRLNARGGAIALGHALGSSGTRLITTLLHRLEDEGGRYGLVTMCEGGGLANATVIERL